jgi:hypothetical protein
MITAKEVAAMARKLFLVVALSLFVAGTLAVVLWDRRIASEPAAAATGLNDVASDERTRAAAVEIDRAFLDLQDGRLHGTDGPHMVSGWQMPLPTGVIVSRSDLITEAQPFIARGKAAAPRLIKWVWSSSVAIRFVSIYSLECITGISAGMSYFAVDEQGDERHAAIKAWEKWLATHA